MKVKYDLKLAIKTATLAIKKAYIKMAMADTNGNSRKAAQLCGLSERSIRYYLKEMRTTADAEARARKYGPPPKIGLIMKKKLPPLSATDREIYDEWMSGRWDIGPICDEYDITRHHLAGIIERGDQRPN